MEITSNELVMKKKRIKHANVPIHILFVHVIKIKLTNKYIGLHCFSEKDHFVDTLKIESLNLFIF
jgi:hypothetical protein